MGILREDSEPAQKCLFCRLCNDEGTINRNLICVCSQLHRAEIFSSCLFLESSRKFSMALHFLCL
jgi:hypothetical protein